MNVHITNNCSTTTMTKVDKLFCKTALNGNELNFTSCGPYKNPESTVGVKYGVWMGHADNTFAYNRVWRKSIHKSKQVWSAWSGYIRLNHTGCEDIRFDHDRRNPTFPIIKALGSKYSTNQSKLVSEKSKKTVDRKAYVRSVYGQQNTGLLKATTD